MFVCLLMKAHKSYVNVVENATVVSCVTSSAMFDAYPNNEFTFLVEAEILVGHNTLYVDSTVKGHRR